MSYSSTSTNTDGTEAAVVAKLARESAGLQPINMPPGSAPVMYNPASREVVSLEEHLPKRARHKGTYDVTNIASLAAAVKHLALPDTKPVLRFTLSSTCIECALNHSSGGSPEWEDYGVTWQLRLDERLVEWKEKCRSPLSQGAFMEFLEERVTDVAAGPQGAEEGATQAQLLQFVSDLRVTSEARFASKQVLANGDHVFESSVESKPSVKCYHLFYLGLPVFEGDEQHYALPVRLRFRVNDGKLNFTLKIPNLDATIKQAWGAVRAAVVAQLPEALALDVADEILV